MNELTREDSKMLQALSVIAMLVLHLFDRNYEGLFEPLVFIGSKPLTFYLGQLSDFCVFGFAFLSGYGHTVDYEKSVAASKRVYFKHRMLNLLNMMICLWSVMIVFSVVAVIVDKVDFMPGTMKTVVFTATTINMGYNGAWWYVQAYVVICILSVLLMHLLDKVSLWVILPIDFVLYFVFYCIRFGKITLPGIWPLTIIGPIGMTVCQYLIGIIWYRKKLFSKIYEFVWVRINPVVRGIAAVLIIVGLLWFRTDVVPSLFVAPISGIIIIILFHYCEKPQIINKTFLFIGGHSTNIWLVHMFFMYNLFEGLAWKARYPVAIFLFLLVLSVASSFVLKLIENPANKIVVNRLTRE